MSVPISSRGGFACLNYHDFGDDGDQYVLGNRQFDDQLKYLKSEGFTVEGFEQLEQRLKTGASTLGRYAVLTIDDGRESTMRAAELLLEHGCQATIFLSRDRCLNKRGYIRAAQIQQLRLSGISVGSHGVTHRKLSKLSRYDCWYELMESKQWLEDVIGEPVIYLAAPGGFVNDVVLRHSYEAGYKLVGTCNEWVNTYSGIRIPGVINRVNVRRHFSMDVIQQIVTLDLRFYIRRQIRAAALWLPKQMQAA